MNSEREKGTWGLGEKKGTWGLGEKGLWSGGFYAVPSA